MIVKKRGAVHLARWSVPVERKGQWQPAGLWAQFFTGRHSVPSRHRFARHNREKISILIIPAVVHVHVIPVVNTCAEDNH